jgi:hypothetical protein
MVMLQMIFFILFHWALLVFESASLFSFLCGLPPLLTDELAAVNVDGKVGIRHLCGSIWDEKSLL